MADNQPEITNEPPEQMGIVAEFMLFLRENKKWWLMPIVIMVALLGLLLVFGATPLGPFIYTLF
jgi:hypothetical protein